MTERVLPARGRKPAIVRAAKGVAARFQLIPARGRKLDGVDAVRELVNISTYPRKGAKKLRIKNGAEFFFCVP